MGKNYRDLEVFQEAYQLAIDAHDVTIKLPKYQMCEEGGQIRQSSKAIVANIVEGYGRRRYKAEFIRFLTYAISSCDGTAVHLDLLHDCKLLAGPLYKSLKERYDRLGRKLNNFIAAVEKGHRP